MEGQPKQEKKEVTVDLVEGGDGVWRTKQETATDEVAEILDAIEGYSEMTVSERITALKIAIDVLEREADGENDYIIDVLTEKAATLIALEHNQGDGEPLGEAVGVLDERV